MNPSARAAFFHYAKRQNLRHIYLEAEDLLSNSQESLAAFLAEANERHMAVSLLAGDPLWTLPERHENAVALAELASEFALSCRAKDQPTPVSFQFDMAPYLLEQWTLALQCTANDYLDLLSKLRASLSPVLDLQIAIPTWFDQVIILRKETEKPLSQWIRGTAAHVVRLEMEGAASPTPNVNDIGESPVMLGVYPTTSDYYLFNLASWCKRLHTIVAKKPYLPGPSQAEPRQDEAVLNKVECRPKNTDLSGRKKGGH